MKLIGLFLIVNFLCFTRGALYQDTRNQGSGKCLSSEYGFELKATHELNPVPGQCMKATCSKDSILNIAGCGVVMVTKSCKLTNGVANAPYPACCPTIKC